jgi:hypothetical protein
MMHSATEATTQDARLSMDEEGDCNINEEPGGLALLQIAHNLTTHVGADAPHDFCVTAGNNAAKTSRLAALRQNARNAARRKFTSRQRADNEIDRRPLRCKLLFALARLCVEPRIPL